MTIPAHRPRKRFGQHFLHDPVILRRMVDAIAPARTESIVEIGPGHGALTLPLLERTDQLTVIELDRDLIGPLQASALSRGQLAVHNTDALKFDFSRLARAPASLRVAGNLPYNISTPLIFHLLDQADSIRDMHFLLQKEVVERLAATPGGHTYGRLSVMVQYRCQVIPLFDVGPGAFNPPPRVNSTFVRLIPHRELLHPAHAPEQFTQLVRQAFSQRRKTLRRSLKDICGPEHFEQAEIDASLRPERLGITDFVNLSNTLVAKATSGRLPFIG